MNANEAQFDVVKEAEALMGVFDERKVMVINKTFLFNHHLLHPRMVDIFTEMLKIEDDNDLNAIVVSEDGPKGKYGEYLPELKMSVISLPRLLEGSIETIEARASNMGIATGIWINMIYTFCHELLHNISLSTKQDLDMIDDKKEDELADKYANDMLEEIQRTMDAEPPALADLPWFNTRIMEYMVNKIKAGDKGWQKQKEMMDSGLVISSDDSQFTSLREYYKATSKDLIWENEGAPLELKTDLELEVVEEEEVIPEEPTAIAGEEQFKPEPAEAPMETQPESMEDLFSNTCPELTAEDMEALDMQELLSDSAPSDEDMKPVFEKNGIEIHKFYPGGKHEVEKNPIMPTPVDHTKDGQPIYGSREDMQKAILLNPEKHGAKPTMSIKEASRRFWMKLYNHMFANCGWENGRFTRLLEGVLMPVAVDDPIMKNIVKSFTGVNSVTYQPWTRELGDMNGMVTGLMFSKETIPAYQITIEAGGKRRTFRLVAQNPAKTSPYAIRARNGERIAWLIECTDPNSKDNYVAKIDNGVYHKRNGRSWIPVNL